MIDPSRDCPRASKQGMTPMMFRLSEEQRAFVGNVRKLAQSGFRARAPKYMDGSFPWENIRELADLGILGMAVPAEYGGSGMGVLDTALVLEEIAKVCYVTAMALLGEVGTQTRVIATYAPESIKRRLLPPVCTGEAILAICMTEPHAGTDVANYRTNATVTGERIRLNGVKTLISRVDEAQAFVVFSRINARPGREGIGCVLVEKGAPGFTCTSRFHTMGREPRGNPLRGLRAAAGKSDYPRGRLSPAALGLQHPALPQPQHLARARRRRIRGIGQIPARAHRLRPAHRRLPGPALEARRHVP